MSISRERATARILVSLGNQQTRSISRKLRNVDFRARKGKMLISRQRVTARMLLSLGKQQKLNFTQGVSSKVSISGLRRLNC